MKILVIDRDRLAAQLIVSKLESQGHTVVHELVKNEALAKVGSEDFDVVFIDPAPLTTARPMVLGLRKITSKPLHKILLGHDLTFEDTIKAGVDDFINKPIDPSELDFKTRNSERTVNLNNRMGDPSYDSVSKNGAIAKSAFNQLYLTAMDRAGRYGEKTNILFIKLSNYDNIQTQQGQDIAKEVMTKISNQIIKIRRLSDILSQTDPNEHALMMLQRPDNDLEPIEAAQRFAVALGDTARTITNVDPEISITLLALPTGEIKAEHMINRDMLNAEQ